MSTDSYILGFLHPRVLTSSGSYIYGGSYNHGFLHLGFLDLGVHIFRVSNIQRFLCPMIQGFMLHSGVLHPSVYHCLTFRGLTFRVLRSRGLTSRGCYIQGLLHPGVININFVFMVMVLKVLAQNVELFFFLSTFY